MKNKILTILFCIFIFGFMIINIIVKNKEISYSERRYLKELPQLNIKNVFNKEITNNLESYLTDHFVLRDKFRTIKTLVNLNVLKKQDNNNLYYKDGYIYKIEYPLKEKTIKSFSNKINNIYDKHLTNMNVYLSIIPDKNYYSNDNNLKMDYDKLFNQVQKEINSNITYIDITKSLTINDYYKTDIHWKQENLSKVVKKLSVNMNFEIMEEYKENYYEPFYGSYYGQLGLNVEADKLTYLTNDIINNAKIKDYDSKTETIYETDSLGKMDSYDVFLSGASSLIEITNESAASDRELIIFRDSFSSSLTPLLLKSYSKITLVDLRYINSSLLTNYIEFNNQDILFLYNSTIINNCEMLK